MDHKTVILVLCSLGIAQGLFLCAYLLTLRKGNSLAHRILVLVILGLVLRIGKSILNVYLHLEPWQRNIGIAGILLVGPSLWLYGGLIFQKRKKIPGLLYLHMLPYVLFTLFSPLIPNRADVLSYLIYYAVFGHLFVYLILSVFQLINAKQVAQPRLFQWCRNLVIGVGLIWLFYIGNITGMIPFYIGGALFFTFLVYMFSFLLLRNHTFSLEKYQGSKIDADSAKSVMESINRLLEQNEVFLNPKLTMADVAETLKISPRILSQVINGQRGMNFSEFMNYHRIEKAKKLLSSSQGMHEKIAAIAYDSGFGNVTSFNLAFKSFTNLTPSEFKRKHNDL
ncbi:helix-turn-helix domain-containing protein [Muricauda sp. JGD-17]|uniref:Helix-turn-helix domain-containing protein n=1 Tax=Flagellimonas ochracea TaxID=2696472 RepID=A0A964WX77_9FLAO|nr:helix-turn-helix domain-containing protein [Allomuricauda ochracea]NAY91523.1 helix-turn-helix domain-containing protein [Allomuricauda ochracea]